jgi:YD repeat-containing protein
MNNCFLNLKIRKFCLAIKITILFQLLQTNPGFTADNKVNNMTYNPLNNQIDQVGKGSVGFTGDMSFEIPLMKVPGRGGLDFNLTASYKAGIRADQEASIIGLGWHLEIGEILRNIRFSHDLYWGARGELPSHDLPDAFSMSTPFGSINFSNFQSDQGIFPEDFHRPWINPIFYPDKWAPWKIEIFQHKYNQNPINYAYMVDGFKIVDENGTQYLFRKALFRESISMCSRQSYDFTQDIEFGNYKWLLTAVLSVDYVDDPGSEDPYNPLDSNYPAIENSGNWIAIEYRFDANSSETFHYQYPNWQQPCDMELTYPYRIVTPTHVAEFTYENEVPDGYESYKSAFELDNRREKRLDRIVLYKYSGIGSEPSSSGDWFQRVEFTYRADEGLQLATPSGAPGMPLMNFGKTTLEQIKIRPKLGEKLFYAFEYSFNPILFYGTDSYNINRDPWNYYNYIYSYGSSEEVCCTAWSLTKMTLPSGGWIEYEYENDRWLYPELKKEGGVRLKSQKIYDGIHPSPAAYNYTYGDNSDHHGYESSLPPEQIRIDHEWSGGNYYFFFADNANDHYIGYDLVTEEMPDGHIIKRYYTTSNEPNIHRDNYVTKEMSNGPPNRYYLLVYYSGSYQYQRGILKKEEYYKPDGVTKIREVQYDYNHEDPEAILHQIYSVYNPCTWPQSISAWVKKNSVTTYEYSDYGADPVVTTVAFEYDDVNGQVKKTTETNSKGKQRIKDVVFAHGSPGSPIYLKNMLSQIASVAIKDELNYNYSKEYTDWRLEGGHYRVGDKWKWEADAPSQSVGKNLHTFDNPIYDNYGNLVQYTNAKGVITSTKWGHNFSVPLATIINAQNDECFIEDFNDQNIDDNQPTDWYTTGSYWTSEDGDLHWTSSGTAQGMCANPQSLNLSNFIAEFDMKVVDGNTPLCWGGFQFRKTNYIHTISSSGYLVYIRENNQLQLYDMVSGYGNILGSFQLSQTPENWHHIKVLAEGNNIKVFADGYLAIDVIDNLYQSGQYIGFEAYRADTKFDNLRIYPSDALCTSQAHDFLSLRPISETDENGTTSYYEYDDLGRLKSISNNDFQTLSEYEYYYSWDGTNNFDPINPNNFREKLYRTPSDYSITKTYSDGLGKNIQVQQQNGSNDINISTDYDFLGRVSKTWKPYSCVSNHAYEDDYDDSNSNPKSAKYYYNGTNGKPDCGDYPFNHYSYRNEFTKELSEDAFPGEEFALGTEHTITNNYFSNNNLDLCDFPEHSLIKTETKDENGNYITSFVDKFGNQVLSRQFPAGGDLPYEEVRLNVRVTNDSAFYTNSREFTVNFDQEVDYHCTFTVHESNNFARFTVKEDGDYLFSEEYVVPPSPTGTDTRSGHFTATKDKIYEIKAIIKGSQGTGTRKSLNYVRYKIKNSTETSFEYNLVSNIIKTTAPSGNENEYKFNTLGQLIAKTTPDLDGNGDGDPTNETLNNPDQRLKYDDNGNLRFSQDANQRNTGKVSFISYDFADRPLVSGEAGYDFASLAGDNSYPFESDIDNWIGVNCYDDLPNQEDFPWQLFPQIGEWANLKGHLVATAYKSADLWQVTYYSYDNHNRVEWKKILIEDFDPVTIEYEYNLQDQLNRKDVECGIWQVHYFYEYNQLGQLHKVFVSEDGNKPSLCEVAYSYNPVGVIENISLHETSSGIFREDIPYTYTVRDWVNEIGDVTDTGEPFGAKYSYLFNGNISVADFFNLATAYPQRQRFRYTFSYDPLDRLSGADYAYYEYGHFVNAQYFDVNNLSYDPNGNILSLTRKKDNGNTIDNLTYVYSYHNRLQSIWDSIQGSAEAWDAEDALFGYDDNGNLNFMDTYGQSPIISIEYDTRNLPLFIDHQSTADISYRYNADGQRIYKKIGNDAADIYLVDGDQVLGVFSESGELKYWNIYGNDLIGRIEY